MKISWSQMERIKASRMESFVARAVTFINDTYPEVSRRADSEKLISLVNFAVQRAGAYRFVSERDIVKYLTVMIALGTRFDDEERFSHLRPALSGMKDTSPSVRVALLVTMTAAIRDQRAGR